MEPTATTGGEGSALAESAWGPVDGIVATRSATGTKTDTPIIETPQSVSVITADRIEQLGATTLNDAVAYTAGVRPNQFGRDCRYDWLSIRGFDAYYPGFYFDGLFARNNNTWAVWRADPQGAERIEVLKGPSSVLYGQMNSGGLINIVSKRPVKDQFLEVETQFGNRDHFQPAFDMGGSLDQNGNALWRVTGRGLMTDTDVDFADCDQSFIAPSFTIRPSAGTTITVLGHYLERDAGIDVMFLPPQGSLLSNPNGRIHTSVNLGEPGFDGFDQSQWMLGYILEHRFNDVWQLRQNARYGKLDTRIDQIYGLGLDAADPTGRTLARRAFFSDETIDQFVVDNQVVATFGSGAAKHTMLFGLDYQNNRFEQLSGDGEAPSIDMFDPAYGSPIGPPPVFADANTKLVQTGVYAQEQLKLFDRLVLVAGGRYDWASNEIDDHLFGGDATHKDEDFTWRAGAVYLLPNGLAPYVSYSTSFLPISGFDPNTGAPFDPETGEQYEAGIKFQPSGLKSLVTFSTFEITRQNYLTFDNMFNPRQTGEILSRGLEVEAFSELWDGLNLIAAYTWLPEFTITESSDPVELGKREPGIEEHSASLWAHYRFPRGRLKGFGFGGGVRYTGETFGDVPNTKEMIVPAFALFDAVVDYETENWRFALNAQNLEDEEYVASCNTTCYYGSGRTVIGTIKRRW
jgi:iron complex outermembrane receptor protein